MAFRVWRPGGFTWQVAEAFGGVGDWARAIRTAPLVAQLLWNRGIDDADKARAFMKPKLNDLHDPALLGGVQLAAERIAQAVAKKEKIVIYGDYDVDGITAVAILHACLKMVDADVDFYIPHRLDEGYGVNTEAIDKIISGGANLIITVDCGISAVEQVAIANKSGVDVIITDHHSPPEQLPDAVAVVHPAIGGTYPNTDLCGAGVAFKLAWQVAREICGQSRVDDKMRDFLMEATCLAALGTIADVVPLVGENRVLAVFGLQGLAATKRPGLRALLDSAGLLGEKLDAYHVGFRLAPRLNAAGRMGHARLAVEMLTRASEARAVEIATYLNTQNTARQKVEREITAQAVEMVRAAGMDAPDRRTIVLASDDWHGGVIGIVASRLVDRFAKPAILIAFNGRGGQGSGRSVPGFNMCDALSACGEYLASFGGHAMAGGVRIEHDNVDAFAASMEAYARDNFIDAPAAPILRIDAETTLSALDYLTVEHIQRMAPFGQGNAAPVVVVRNCKVLIPPRRIGKTGRTVTMTLQQDGVSMRTVGFSMGDLADHLAGATYVDAAAEPVLNTFNGRTTVELQLKDVKRI